MRIFRLDIRHFRGFDNFSLRPSGHAVLVGPPRAGRSDLVEALRRVLSAEATRAPLNDDMDFFARDVSKRAEVEVVLGDLGVAQEQDFFDQLELWDDATGAVVEDLPSPFDIDKVERPWVIRLCYRAEWDATREEAAHWVDFPKLSRPDEDQFERIGRRHRDVPFSVAHAEGRPLSLGPRGLFRQVVADASGDDFARATTELTEASEKLGVGFSSSEQVGNALSLILDPLRSLLGVGDAAATDVIRFAPEGGSVAGVLRSLTATLSLGEGGSMPVYRQGSSVEAALRVAEALAALPKEGGILAIDDFGENLDSAAAQQLAGAVRGAVSQAWVTTRRPAVAEAFRASELIRLSTSPGGRVAHLLPAPRSRAERAQVRHAVSKLLSAVTAASVIVVEGRHDREALSALALRLLHQDGHPLPAAFGVVIIESGEGKDALGPVAAAARNLGLHTVAVLDYDHGDTDERRDELLKYCDCVVRLSYGHAVERALVEGLDDNVVRATCNAVISDYSLQRPAISSATAGKSLIQEVCVLLKSSGGLHTEYLGLLPEGVHPAMACAILSQAVDAAHRKRSGAIQL